MKQVISDPLAATNTGGYSPALRVGDWVFVSGQGPISPQGDIVPGDIKAQTRLTMENVMRLLEAAGGRMDQIVKCSCFLASMDDFAAFDAVYRSFFDGALPARTTVQAGLDGILVEIDATALLGEIA